MGRAPAEEHGECQGGGPGAPLMASYVRSEGIGIIRGIRTEHESATRPNVTRISSAAGTDFTDGGWTCARGVASAYSRLSALPATWPRRRVRGHFLKIIFETGVIIRRWRASERSCVPLVSLSPALSPEPDFPA